MSFGTQPDPFRNNSDLSSPPLTPNTLTNATIGPEDIAAMNDDYFTDTCIRILVHEYGNRSSCVKFVDPSFYAELRRSNFRMDGDYSKLLRPNPGAEKLQGLAIPCHIREGRDDIEHWVVYYLNFEARGMVLFDSSRCDRGSKRGEVFMELLCKNFASYGVFATAENPFEQDFVFLEDPLCAQQSDGVSCGIYALRNCLDLLDHRRPLQDTLSQDQITTCRKIGTELLNNRMNELDEQFHRRKEQGLRDGTWNTQERPEASMRSGLDANAKGDMNVNATNKKGPEKQVRFNLSNEGGKAASPFQVLTDWAKKGRLGESSSSEKQKWRYGARVKDEEEDFIS